MVRIIGRIFLLVIIILSISGCEDYTVIRTNSGNIVLECINAHVYIRTTVHGGYTFSPLFDYKSTSPRLISCRRTSTGELALDDSAILDFRSIDFFNQENNATEKQGKY